MPMPTRCACCANGAGNTKQQHLRAVKIYNDAEVEVKSDFGTIGEAARTMFREYHGVKVYRGKHEITQWEAESGELG